MRLSPPRLSSPAWIQRQFSDPYVRQRLSSPENYRSRSAFKLLELDQHFNSFLTRPHVRSVIDLGAAPGGWSQVVARKFGWSDKSLEPEKAPVRGFGYGEQGQKRAKEFGSWSSPLDIDEQADDFQNASEAPKSSTGRKATIVAVDLLKMSPIPGVYTIKADFLAAETASLVHELLCGRHNPEGKADIILSDMAMNISGNTTRDTESSLEICDAVFNFARAHLRTAESIGIPKGGCLVLKHFMHPLLQRFRVDMLNPNFNYVFYVKPKSSRTESKEGYWVCQGWNPRQ